MTTTDVLRQTLGAAAERFREYEATHRRKAGSPGLSPEGVADSTAKADRNAHMANLCEAALAQPADEGFDVRLDLALGPQSIREGHLNVRLPVLPNPGEALGIGPDRFLVHARIHNLDPVTGAYSASLLVEKPNGRVQMAPAGALDQIDAQAKRAGIILK